MAPADPRQVVGANVSALATLVTNERECERHFGSNARTKVLTGVVKAIQKDTSRARTRTFLEIEWSIVGSVKKTKRMLLRNVKNASIPNNNTSTASLNDAVEAHGILWKKEKVSSPIGRPVSRRQ